MKYIVVEGNIGAGKTSLAQRLASELRGTSVLEEFAENTFLPLFYEDPAKFAFPLELSFLAARYKQLTGLFEQPSGPYLVADYHFEKSLLFASVNLPASEFKLYESFFNILNRSIRPPDLVVFLRKNVETLRENISKRGRNFESGISDKYLADINEAYENLLRKQHRIELLEIDSDNLDFVQKSEDYDLIIKAIKAKL